MTTPTNNRPTPETDAIMDNIKIAMTADNDGQRVDHKAEAHRCIEELERQRDELKDEVERLRGEVSRIWSMLSATEQERIDRMLNRDKKGGGNEGM